MPYHLGESNDGEEEKDLLHKHVAKVVRPHLVEDRVAVSEADAVASVASRTSFEHLAHDLLADADAMELGVAQAGLDLLLHESGVGPVVLLLMTARHC